MFTMAKGKKYIISLYGILVSIYANGKKNLVPLSNLQYF
jgi:hypothetical protein